MFDVVIEHINLKLWKNAIKSQIVDYSSIRSMQLKLNMSSLLISLK